MSEPTPTTSRTAKLQVLYLPEQKTGEGTTQPFALVLSEAPDDLDEATLAEMRTFREKAGAAAMLVTPIAIEVC